MNGTSPVPADRDRAREASATGISSDDHGSGDAPTAAAQTRTRRTPHDTDQLILAALDAHPSWPPERVLPRLVVDCVTGCQLWTGARSGGYGSVRLPGRVASVRVHRLVWLAFRGPIAPGLVLDHDGPDGCRIRSCAEPAHLVVTTQRINSLSSGRGWAADPITQPVRRARRVTRSRDRTRTWSGADSPAGTARALSASGSGRSQQMLPLDGLAS